MLTSTEKINITTRIVELEKELSRPVDDERRAKLESEALSLESWLYASSENKRTKPEHPN
ncbi:hypothetical protein EK599_04545 [Vibrio sp. T187]|uniref:hypothetical protein n=1 Tax=Vibrio TaxID=662 RepID=UPI0010C97CCF|nr:MULTISPECIES: hypothetical protein [Vibrio]MBW3694948.1 hypothetical protein [Vibrio sp. T187]